MVPAIFVHCFFCICWIFEILTKNRVTSHANLSFWGIWLACIVHFWYINQLKLCCWVWSSNVSIVLITFIGDKYKWHRFCLPIWFTKITLYRFSKKLQNLRRYWGRSSDHQSDLSSKNIFDFRKIALFLVNSFHYWVKFV